MSEEAPQHVRISDAGYLNESPKGGPELTVTGIGEFKRRVVMRTTRHSWSAVEIAAAGGTKTTAKIGDTIMLTCAKKGCRVEIGTVVDLYQIQHAKNNPTNEFSVDVQWFFSPVPEMMGDDADNLEVHPREVFISDNRDSNVLADTFEGLCTVLHIAEVTAEVSQRLEQRLTFFYMQSYNPDAAPGERIADVAPPAAPQAADPPADAEAQPTEAAPAADAPTDAPTGDRRKAATQGERIRALEARVLDLEAQLRALHAEVRASKRQRDADTDSVSPAPPSAPPSPPCSPP